MRKQIVVEDTTEIITVDTDSAGSTMVLLTIQDEERFISVLLFEHEARSLGEMLIESANEKVVITPPTVVASALPPSGDCASTECRAE